MEIGSAFAMKFIDKSATSPEAGSIGGCAASEARPHLFPLPRGEGEIFRCFSVCSVTHHIVSYLLILRQTNREPSPGGEGRGEGEL